MEIQQVTNSVSTGYAPNAPAPDANRSQVAQEVTKSAVAPVPAPVHAVQASSSTAKAEQIKDSVSKINKAVQVFDRNLQFTVDEDTKMNVVKVVDLATKDVIRQIPSEEVLAIAKALDKLQGLLVKEKA